MNCCDFLTVIERMREEGDRLVAGLLCAVVLGGPVAFQVPDAWRGYVGLEVGCSQGRRRRRKTEGELSLAIARLYSHFFSTG